MRKTRLTKLIGIFIIISLFLSIIKLPNTYAEENTNNVVNLSKLTYTSDGKETELKRYTQEEFEAFVEDYKTGNLPEVYVTEFLFDGVSMVKSYDLDDFIEEGNEVEVDPIEITVININKMGNIELIGELTGGMIAVDTNGRTGEINLILNGVNIDTDSKKVPAVLVYNKDITYTGCKVTIKTATESKNYIEGGKLKKVSLVESDKLDTYSNKYSGENKTNYTTYTNYYGVYTSDQINDILFAKIQADNEDLAEGDPYYFYKAAGAISSDIDLNFEGTGYLEVTSKNNEGIETKGNLTLSGSTGDYVVYAEDDCLNTTTSSTNNQSARNAITIDVNSLVAIVDGGEDSDEGDSIDSNGTLVVNGGTIIAIAHPGQDTGLDSVNGTYINGGTVLATGDMYDAVSSESKQNYMVLSFQESQKEGTLITLLDEDDKVVMAYQTDRSFTNLIYSSAELVDGTYSLYKGGEIDGTSVNGFYTEVSNYTKGTQQGYSSTGAQGGMQRGEMPGNMQAGERPAVDFTENNSNGGISSKENINASDFKRGNKSMTDNQQNREMMPSEKMTEEDRPGGIMPSEGMQEGDGENRTIPEGELTRDGEMKLPENDDNFENTSGNGMNMRQKGNFEKNYGSATNKDFSINGISNQFGGVGDYTESASSENGNETNDESSKTENDSNEENAIIKNLKNPATIGIEIGIIVVLIVIVVLVVVKKRGKALKKETNK